MVHGFSEREFKFKKGSAKIDWVIANLDVIFAELVLNLSSLREILNQWLEVSFIHLGFGLLWPSWRVWGCLGRVLGLSWARLGASWARHGPTWMAFGSPWSHLGTSWEPLERVLGASWAILGAP